MRRGAQQFLIADDRTKGYFRCTRLNQCSPRRAAFLNLLPNERQASPKVSIACTRWYKGPLCMAAEGGADFGFCIQLCLDQEALLLSQLHLLGIAVCTLCQK
jgi:hypothetical protein